MVRMKRVKIVFREMKQLIRIRDIRVIRRKMIRLSRWMRLWRCPVLTSNRLGVHISAIPMLCRNPVSVNPSMTKRLAKW